MNSKIVLSLILFFITQGAWAQSGEKPNERPDAIEWPEHIPQNPERAVGTGSVPTDITYWSGVPFIENTTVFEHALSLYTDPVLLNDSAFRNAFFQALYSTCFFMDNTQLASEKDAIYWVRSNEKIKDFQNPFIRFYERLVTNVSQHKREYIERSLDNEDESRDQLGLSSVAIKEETDFRGKIDWNKGQKGLSCVSHATVACLKATQPLLARFFVPQIMHQQMKEFERLAYGIDDPRGGFFTETFTSFLLHKGYRVYEDEIKKENSEYVELLEEKFSKSTLTSEEPPSFNLVLKSNYYVLPYTLPVLKEMADITEDDLLQREKPFNGDIHTVLKGALSREVPLLPIIFLDTYDSKSFDIVENGVMARYLNYEFNPNGMEHAVMMAGYRVCPKGVGKPGETCYLIRDSIKPDGNYGWVPASNLEQRTMNFVFLTDTQVSRQ